MISLSSILHTVLNGNICTLSTSVDSYSRCICLPLDLLYCRSYCLMCRSQCDLTVFVGSYLLQDQCLTSRSRVLLKVIGPTVGLTVGVGGIMTAGTHRGPINKREVDDQDQGLPVGPRSQDLGHSDQVLSALVGADQVPCCYSLTKNMSLFLGLIFLVLL